MKTTLAHLRLSSLLFYIALGVRIVAGAINITVIMYTSYGPMLYRLMWYAGLICAMLSIIIQTKTTVKSLVMGTFLIVVFGLASYYSGTNRMIELAVYTIAARNASNNKIMKMYLVIHVVVAIGCVIFSSLGILENIVWNQGGRTRYSLGYRYSTYISKVLFFSVYYYLFLKQKKIRFIDIILIEIINYIIYTVTASRTTFYLLCIFPVVCYLLRWKKETDILSKRRRYLYYMIYPICAAFSFFVLYQYMMKPTVLLTGLNSALSNRLWISARSINTYGFSLFGEPILWVGQVARSLDTSLSINFIDCSYLNIVMTYGIFSFLVSMFLLILIMKYLCKFNSSIIIVLQIMLGVHFMIEPQLVDLTYCNLFLLTIPAIVYTKPQDIIKRRDK